MTSAIRVVIVDDQALIRAGLKMLIDAEDGIEVVGEAADGYAGVDLVVAERPDVALMDIRMPGLDGVQATARIASTAGLVTRVLVLTTFDTDDGVIAALRAGASGFLLKDTGPDDMIRAVHAVAAGDSVLSPSAMRRLLDALGPGFDSVTRGADVLGIVGGGTAASAPDSDPAADVASHPNLTYLTEREIEVLTLIGQGLNNAEIAGQLVLAESTVKTHVSRILMKLPARDRVQAVIVAHRVGLVS